MKNTDVKKPAPSSRFITVSVIIFVLVIGWLIALTVFVSLQSAQLKDSAYQNGQNMLDGFYKSARLEFCVDNGVKPCDDDAIRAFNATIPADDRFTLTRPILPRP